MDTLDQLKQTHYLGDIFLDFLSLKYNNFIEEFQKFAPKIQNEILTASLDPNCSCRNKIKMYVSVFNEESIEFLYNFANENNLLLQLEEMVSFAAEVHSYKMLSGKISKIKIEEWESFSEKLKNNVYFKGFSVLKENDDLLIFFL